MSLPCTAAVPDGRWSSRSPRPLRVCRSWLSMRDRIDVPLSFEHSAGMRERAEQGLVEQFVAQAADEGFRERVLHRLARRDVVQATLRSSAHCRMAFEVSSVPLFGLPRSSSSRSSSRATRIPEIEVSATSARHSRVQSSIRGFPYAFQRLRLHNDPSTLAPPCRTGLFITALPPLLPFPFLPSRLLAPAELCARRLGPLICHCITHLR
jgi:hypothetical protein